LPGFWRVSSARAERFAGLALAAFNLEKGVFVATSAGIDSGVDYLRWVQPGLRIGLKLRQNFGNGETRGSGEV
jgi:hypothetical protein